MANAASRPRKASSADATTAAIAPSRASASRSIKPSSTPSHSPSFFSSSAARSIAPSSLCAQLLSAASSSLARAPPLWEGAALVGDAAGGAKRHMDARERTRASASLNAAGDAVGGGGAGGARYALASARALVARADRARAEAVDARGHCDATALEIERLAERLDDADAAPASCARSSSSDGAANNPPSAASLARLLRVDVALRALRDASALGDARARLAAEFGARDAAAAGGAASAAAASDARETRASPFHGASASEPRVRRERERARERE